MKESKVKRWIIKKKIFNQIPMYSHIEIFLLLLLLLLL